jgi:hypothetical protein
MRGQYELYSKEGRKMKTLIILMIALLAIKAGYIELAAIIGGVYTFLAYFSGLKGH